MFNRRFCLLSGIIISLFIFLSGCDKQVETELSVETTASETSESTTVPSSTPTATPTPEPKITKITRNYNKDGVLDPEIYQEYEFNEEQQVCRYTYNYYDYQAIVDITYEDSSVEYSEDFGDFRRTFLIYYRDDGQIDKRLIDGEFIYVTYDENDVRVSDKWTDYSYEHNDGCMTFTIYDRQWANGYIEYIYVYNEYIYVYNDEDMLVSFCMINDFDYGQYSLQVDCEYDEENRLSKEIYDYSSWDDEYFFYYSDFFFSVQEKDDWNIGVLLMDFLDVRTNGYLLEGKVDTVSFEYDDKNLPAYRTDTWIDENGEVVTVCDSDYEYTYDK